MRVSICSDFSATKIRTQAAINLFAFVLVFVNAGCGSEEPQAGCDTSGLLPHIDFVHFGLPFEHEGVALDDTVPYEVFVLTADTDLVFRCDGDEGPVFNDETEPNQHEISATIRCTGLGVSLDGYTADHASVLISRPEGVYTFYGDIEYKLIEADPPCTKTDVRQASVVLEPDTDPAVLGQVVPASPQVQKSLPQCDVADVGYDESAEQYAARCLYPTPKPFDSTAHELFSDMLVASTAEGPGPALITSGTIGYRPEEVRVHFSDDGWGTECEAITITRNLLMTNAHCIMGGCGYLVPVVPPSGSGCSGEGLTIPNGGALYSTRENIRVWRNFGTGQTPVSVYYDGAKVAMWNAYNEEDSGKYDVALVKLETNIPSGQYYRARLYSSYANPGSGWNYYQWANHIVGADDNATPAPNRSAKYSLDTWYMSSGRARFDRLTSARSRPGDSGGAIGFTPSGTSDFLVVALNAARYENSPYDIFGPRTPNIWGWLNGGPVSGCNFNAGCSQYVSGSYVNRRCSSSSTCTSY